MIQIECPHCGQRNQDEYRYGGAYNPRPTAPKATSDSEWADYVYMRANRRGAQREWWYHRYGCGAWFLAERDTATNQIRRTWIWQPPEPSS